MILIIDNYDSFVFNVARYFEELGEHIIVQRNDAVQVGKAKAIVISPGPGTPYEAGQSLEILKQYAGKLPIFGICLGHQAIGAAFGAKVTRAKRPLHGEASVIEHNETGIFAGLPQGLSVGRYHSLIVEDVEKTELQVTARAENGEIMGLQHKTLPIYGVQFHPESILTEHGYDLISNFIKVIA